MTFIGKFLVLLNVAISLVLMAVGIGLYSTRLDWSETPAKGTTPPGLILAPQEDYKKANELVLPARKTLAENTAELAAARQKRANAQAFYGKQLNDSRYLSRDEQVKIKQELEKLKKEMKMGGVDARAVLAPREEVATGLPTVQPDGTLEMKRATDREGQPLGPIEWYELLLNKSYQAEDDGGLRKLYLVERGNFDNVTKKDTAKAEELSGPADKKTKGLLDLILAERDKEVDLRDEILAIAPPLKLSGGEVLVAPKTVEAAILARRIELLNKQIADMEKTAEGLQKKLDGGAAGR